jgi:hypothetical protein
LLELETERVERFVMVESEAAKTEIGDRRLRIAVAFVLKIQLNKLAVSRVLY